jgi:membrane protein YdbS with pleckstrin-like domain
MTGNWIQVLLFIACVVVIVLGLLYPGNSQDEKGIVSVFKFIAVLVLVIDLIIFVVRHPHWRF